MGVEAAVDPVAADGAAGAELDISVVIPCLNEVRTVAACVAAAFAGIGATGLRGEVIVADNGSTDGSIDAAEAAGARVVHVPRRGYGAALQAGFLAAGGRLLVMGDADLSYDFGELPKLVAEQRRTGADIVLGDRLGGRIEPGAMPWTHRWIGNPLISFTLRRLFKAPLNDCCCGLRLLTRESHRRLRLNTSSMEFALEMIVQGALVGLRFSQVPITLHVDGRDRAPHLRTMRDGYRHFRFLFQHAPATLYGAVGGLAIAAGFTCIGQAAWLEVLGGAPAPAESAVGGALVISGWLLVVLGIIARVFVTGFLGGASDPLQGLLRLARLETAVLGSIATLAAGLAVGIGLGRWQALFQLGLTLSTVAMGTFVGAFVISLIGRAIPAREELAAGEGSAVPAVALVSERTSSRQVLAAAPSYDRWLAGSLREAWEGADRVLDFGCATGVGVAIATTTAGCGVESARIDTEAALLLVQSQEAAADGTVVPFDAVVSAGLVELVEDDVAAMQAMASRLAPGGRLGLLVPGGGERLYGNLDVQHGHLRRYTPPRLRMRLRSAGFQVESIRSLDVLGAVEWFVRGRVRRADGELATVDRLVPAARRVDALLGPPFGRWLVAIARRPASAG